MPVNTAPRSRETSKQSMADAGANNNVTMSRVPEVASAPVVVTPPSNSTSNNLKQPGKVVGNQVKDTKANNSYMKVEKKVVDELLLVCGVIGSTVDPVSQKIVPVTDCISWLQDLQRALRRDEDAFRPISILLGKWKIVEQKLLPLVLSCKYDSSIVITILKILVILTKPLSESAKKAGRTIVDVKSGKLTQESIQEQIRLRENALAQADILVTYKRLFVHHPSHRNTSNVGKEKKGLFSIFISLLTEPLSRIGTARTSDDHLTIELVLHLIRNLLSAGEFLLKGSIGNSKIQESISLHLEMIQLLERELVLDIILVIGQEMESRENKQYNLLIMEILHHLLKTQDPTLVARSENPHIQPQQLREIQSHNTHVKSSSSSGLKMKLEAERQKMVTAVSSRHSHFGANLLVNGKTRFLNIAVDINTAVDIGVDSVPISAGTTVAERRKSKKHQVFVGCGRNLAAHTRPGASFSAATQDMGQSSNLAHRVLHSFCKKFVSKCYGPVMKSLKNEFRRESNRLEEGDAIVFFRIIWFFCQWRRQFRDEPANNTGGALIFTMDVFMFSRVVKATEYYYDHKKYEDLAQTVALYSEMIHLLFVMFHSKDTTEHVMALGLMDRLFYHPEAMDCLPKLFSRWIPGTFPREYLCDLVEISHVTLKLLEANSKLCAEFSDRANTRGRKKKGDQRKFIEPKDAVTHMKAIAADFDVTSYFTRKLVSNQVVFIFSQILSHYDINADHINRHIVAFLIRLSRHPVADIISIEDDFKDDKAPRGLSSKPVTLERMLFSYPFLVVVNKILNDTNLRKSTENEFLLSFAVSLVRHYAFAAEENPMVHMEILFRHPAPMRFCELSSNFYISDEIQMLSERDALLERRMGNHPDTDMGPETVARHDNFGSDEEEMEFVDDFVTFENSDRNHNEKRRKTRIVKNVHVGLGISSNERDKDLHEKFDVDETNSTLNAVRPVLEKNIGDVESGESKFQSSGLPKRPLLDPSNSDEDIRAETGTEYDDGVIGSGKPCKRFRKVLRAGGDQSDDDDTLLKGGICPKTFNKPNWDEE